MEPRSHVLIRVVGFLALLGLTGCPGCPPPNPTPTPVTPTGTGGAPSYASTCDGVCALGTSLGCAWAQPTPKGASCPSVCTNNQAQGFSAWDLACRSKQTSCVGVDANCR